jgi:hypothetical protein
LKRINDFGEKRRWHNVTPTNSCHYTIYHNCVDISFLGELVVFSSSSSLSKLSLLSPKKTSLIFDTFDLHALVRSKCGGEANFFIRSRIGNKFFKTLDIGDIGCSVTPWTDV